MSQSLDLNWSQSEVVPEEIKQTIRSFSEDILSRVSEQLLSISLYGSLVKGEFDEDTSDINVVLLFKTLPITTLEVLSEPLLRYKNKFDLSVFLMTEKDLHRSTDVFPIKFLDIQHHHHVVWGEDLLQSMKVDESHLRLRCEQELKNLMLKMRSMYTHRFQNEQKMVSTLNQIIPSFFINLDALLYLKTGKHSTTKNVIAQKSSDILDLNLTDLKEFLELKRGEKKFSAEQINQLFQSLLEMVEKTADIVDQIEG